MGLDYVELVMATEETFGIEITDDEASSIRTPRNLYDLIARKLQVEKSEVCLTQRAFYLIRKAIRSEWPVPRSGFRPNTPLDKLIPRRDRKKEWKRLGAKLGAIQWPKLKYPVPLVSTVGLVMFTIWLILSHVSAVVLHSILAIRMVLAAGIVMMLSYVLFNALLRPLRTSLAGQTAGSLSEYLVAFNPQLLAFPSTSWTRERVRSRTRNLIVEQLSISPNFDDDASFLDDLGVE